MVAQVFHMLFKQGNSFNVIYDNIKSLNFYGELNIDASKKFNLGASINYASFTPENEVEVWNTPSFRATITANYNNNSWFAGTKLFYRGETKDLVFLKPVRFYKRTNYYKWNPI